MLYAIIAAGEGSRLSNEGFTGLKPMVAINGEMMIDRLINIFLSNSAEAIYVIINENSAELEEHLLALKLPIPLKLIKKTTISSLHSFHELLLGAGPLEELCLTTTDTVFDQEEFSNYIKDFNDNKDNDGVLAVTSFIDDESPLYVNFGDNYRIKDISDQPLVDKPFVSGGIYCLRKSALKTVPMAIANGLNRMRNFQRLMIEEGLVLKAHPFQKIMDVDHVADIDKAEQFLNEIQY
jgi:NDP-sugar pyrophosphorylase family protein